MTGHIAVVGCGIVGASIAYHLSEATDAQVTVYERRDDVAAETTRKSGAFVGHWGFEDPIRLRMLRYALRLYKRFLDEPREDLRYTHCGRFHFATTPEGDASLREQFEADHGVPATGSTTTAMNGTPIQYLDGDELENNYLLPEIDVGRITGAIASPNMGFIDASAFAREFVARAGENGATFRTGVRVDEVAVEDGAVAGLVVDGERVDADRVVCAAGPWNARFIRDVGIDLPLRHTMGPVEVHRPARPSPHTFPAFLHEETGAYYRQTPDGDVFVGNYKGDYHAQGTEYDPDDLGDEVPADRRAVGQEVLAELLPGLAEGETVDEWVGIRSLTPDGLPILGWTAIEGFSIAAFNASGVQLAPITGRILADQLVDGEPTEYYDDVSVTRFDGFSDVRPAPVG